MAQDNAAFVRQIRAFNTDSIGFLNPAGLAFSPGANTFHVVKALAPDLPTPPNTDIVKITPVEERVGSDRIAVAMKSPIDMAFDSQLNRLLLFQSRANQLIEVLEGSDGDLNPMTLVRHDVRHLVVQDAQGMTVDPTNGHLLILDALQLEIIRVEPEPEGGFDNAVISIVDLQGIEVVSSAGAGHRHHLPAPGLMLRCWETSLNYSYSTKSTICPPLPSCAPPLTGSV